MYAVHRTLGHEVAYIFMEVKTPSEPKRSRLQVRLAYNVPPAAY